MCIKPIRNIIVLLLLIMTPPLFSEEEKSAGDRPAILFITSDYNPPYNLYLKQYLRETLVPQGFEVDIAFWKEVNRERLRRFNVVVVVEWKLSMAYNKLNEKDQELLETIQQFVKEGGGLFVSGTSYPRLHIVQQLLAPHGLTAYDEIVKVRDESQMKEGTSFARCFFSYTTNIKALPVTAGVSGIWFPILGQKNWATLESPFEAGNRWQILVKGMDFTYSEPIPGVAHVYAANPMLVARKKGVDAEVPLFAIKDAKPGRLAFCAICPVLTYYSGTSPGIDNVVLSKGIGERKSDMGKLLLNTFRWLAEPSLQQKQLGGFKTDPKKIARATISAEDMAPPVDLNFQKPLQQFKGIIGAQSVYSGGKSSLDEYKKAAEKAGLDYVAFLEDGALMDEQKYRKLCSECQQLSDDRVTLIPGFRMDDEMGNHWYCISSTVPFPDETFLTVDKKKFRLANLKGRGEWVPTHRYFTTYFPFFGNYLYCKSASPYWDFKNYLSTALFTYEGGQQLDELPLQHFLELQSAGNLLCPITVNLISSASEIKTILEKNQYITVIFKSNREALQKEGPVFVHYQITKPVTYVSNGPEIHNWQYVNRDYTAFSWFSWSNYRYNVRFLAKSEKGLKEVCVYDGTRLLRRFVLKGIKEYQQELHLVHQQQKELTLVVTDVDGKRAISDVHWDASYLLKEYFMSDRYNKGVYSQQPADSEWGFSRAPRAVPVYSFAHGTFSDDLFYLVNSQELESPGFDGPPGGMPSISSAVSLRIDGVPPLNGRRFARRIDRPLVSADVRIGEATFTHRYPEDIPLWFGGNVWLPVTESKYYEGKQRYYCFNMKPGMPGIAYVDGEVKIKEDVRFSAEDPVPLSLGGIICTKASGLDTFYASSDDRVVKFNFEDANQEMNFAGAFPKYSYITFFPSHFGSITIYSLTDGLGYFYDQRGHCRFGFTMKGKEIKAGTVLKYQYLAMTGDRSWTPSNAMSRKIKAFTGLGGKPEYALRLEKGKIVSQEYICRLDGEKEGVAGIFPVKNLPCTLPVVVENLNDKWAAIYYEREKKRCRPVGLLDNAAYVQLGTGAEDPHVFIGHPFTCNNRDVFLNLVQTGEKHWTLEIHNPTDQLVKLEIKKSKWFDLIKTDDFGVTVNAGASCVKEFE